MSGKGKGFWILAVAGVVVFAANTEGEGGPPPGAIPDEYKGLYQEAATTCPNLDAALLAGVGSVESNHGQSTLAGVQSGANSAGAMGPMQFLQSTWDGVRAAHPEIGADIYDAADAVAAAAHLLCDTGVRAGDVDGALWLYNHDDEYVAEVKRRADEYRRTGAV